MSAAPRILAAGFLLLLVAAAAVACPAGPDRPSGPADGVQGDSSEKRIAALLGRKVLVDFLTDRGAIEVDSTQFKGTATAVDPAENAELEIRDIQSGFGVASVTADIKSPFAIRGRLKVEGKEEPIEVAGEGVLALTAQASAEIFEKEGRVAIRARVEELKCAVDEVREQSPPDLPGVKGVVEDAFREIEEGLRRDINEWLAENAIDPNADE